MDQQLNVQPKSYTRYMPYLAAGIGVGAAAYLAYRWLSTTSSPYMSPHVEENLPIAKSLQTVPDTSGNYDIDGVSFDTEGVIISGDDTKSAKPSIN